LLKGFADNKQWSGKDPIHLGSSTENTQKEERRPTMEQITSKEQKTLERLEEVIEKGLPTFIDVGKALIKIRDERLYRAGHKTFGNIASRDGI